MELKQSKDGVIVSFFLNANDKTKLFEHVEEFEAKEKALKEEFEAKKKGATK